MNYCLFTYLGKVESYNESTYFWNNRPLNEKKDKFYLRYLNDIFRSQPHIIYLFTTEKMLKQSGGENIVNLFNHFGIDKDQIKKFLNRRILENLSFLESIFEKNTGSKLKIKVKKEKLEKGDLQELTSIIKELNNKKLDILFDITHSYRDIPLFYLSMIDLITSAEDISINIDFLYVREIEEEKANIELLSDIKEFQSWSDAVFLMKKSFNLALLAQLMENYSQSIAENLKNIHLYFSLNLLSLLQKEIQKLMENLNKEGKSLPISYSLIEEDVNRFIYRFNKQDFSEFQKEICKFSFENSMYDKGILALREYLISMLTSCYYEDIKNPKNRGYLESLINCKRYLKNELNISDEILDFLTTITNSRNLIAHLKGYKSLEKKTINFIENLNFKDVEKKLETLKEQVIKIIKNGNELEQIVENLRNNWEEECKSN